jgi:hypothetical protein
MALPGSFKKKINITQQRANIEYPYSMQSGAAENRGTQTRVCRSPAL